jgi:hypothetical protein
MFRNQKLLSAGIVVMIGLTIFTFNAKGTIAAQFQSSLNALKPELLDNFGSQKKSLSAQQQRTLVEVDKAILEAERLLANSDNQPDQKPVLDLSTYPTPWKPKAADNTVQPSFSLNPRVKSFEVVTLEMHPESFPSEGEQLVLPMLNGKRVKVNVLSTSIEDNGDKTWSGHVDGYGNEYPVVMTYGEGTTFATITTPEGSYSMESVKGVGWLYKNPAEIELTALGKGDYVIPAID